MKEIDGEYYIDGGYYDNLPINLALDMGADDYVIKPFRTRELISRINSVLRRYQKNTSGENQMKCQNILIDNNTDTGMIEMLMDNNGYLLEKQEIFNDYGQILQPKIYVYTK